MESIGIGGFRFRKGQPFRFEIQTIPDAEGTRQLIVPIFRSTY